MKGKSSLIALSMALIISIGLREAFADMDGKPPPLTLKDCYNLALKRSETIAINSERISEAEARFHKAFGGLLPHVYFASTDGRRDSGVSLYPQDYYERKFTFKQTLFSGFREFVAIAGSRLEGEQRENEFRRAGQSLFLDVSDAFYLLMEERADLKILNRIASTLQERITELKERARLGRARRSEIAATSVQLYNIYAELELIKGQEALARQLLEFLVGMEIGDIIDSADAFIPLEPETNYISKAAGQRPDVQAAKLAWDIAEKNVSLEKSRFSPTLKLEGDYYVGRNTVPRDAKWDAKLRLDMPIFEGTETIAAVKEAESKARQLQLQYRLTERGAIHDIQDAHSRLKASLARAEAFRKALRKAELNYHLQEKDFRLNLTSNLDVLAAIQTQEDARRNYSHALYEGRRLYWQLRVAAGDIESQEIK